MVRGLPHKSDAITVFWSQAPFNYHQWKASIFHIWNIADVPGPGCDVGVPKTPTDPLRSFFGGRTCTAARPSHRYGGSGLLPGPCRRVGRSTCGHLRDENSGHQVLPKLLWGETPGSARIPTNFPRLSACLPRTFRALLFQDLKSIPWCWSIRSPSFVLPTNGGVAYTCI